ncbi:hypothetical protein H0H81_009407 [Sphagnurus paluster]|uniref:Uncharacterized protein n=1 Tax=Sphagnurus paluster TaxID=117069 RepID=A0A9P7FX95_9AGAR|nr:hypothetical protein H0H81_009407 [Sphagnurus paluster]
MPPRPAPLSKSKHSANRLSAVYIGSGNSPSYNAFNGSPSNLPDLPEPPSPGASSTGSGLPSPPATNSTGSGSTTDDPQAIASLNERPLSFETSGSSSSTGGGLSNLKDLGMGSSSGGVMLKGPPSQTRALHRSASSISSISSTISRPGERLSIFEERLPPGANDDDGDGDGDDTARFELRRSLDAGASNENTRAIQRAHSLTQRNRMVIDKLAGYPRTGTPSRSSNSGSSTTSSRLSRRPTSSSSSALAQSHEEHSPSAHYDPRSGSETERESTSAQSHHSSSSKSHRSTTAYNHSTIGASGSGTHQRTLSYAQTQATPRAKTPPTYRRTRVPSAPSSPLQIRNEVSNGSGESSPSRRRKRVSLASGEEERGTARIREQERDREREGILGSTRRRGSPGPSLGSARRRAALPLEFRSPDPENEQEPQTPLRAPSMVYTTSSSSSSSVAPPSAATTSRLHRSSTLRIHSHSHDLTTSSRRGGGTFTPVMGMSEYRERKQSLRGGSAESALAGGGGGRTLVGEGLRAAGLSPTRRRAQHRLSLGGAREEVGWESEEDPDHDDHGHGNTRRRDTAVGSGAARAATSMADYRYLGREGDGEHYTYPDEENEQDRRRALRNSKSAVGPLRLREEPSLTRDHDRSLARDTLDLPERAPSALNRYGTLTRAHMLQDSHRQSPSPFGSRRLPTQTLPPQQQPQTPNTGQQNLEHTRLLVESLAMFEGHIARSSLGGGGAAGELVRGAQAVVGSVERLNEMLRYGTARAVEEQVDAEVDAVSGQGRETISDVWGRVGQEYREGLRVSDELVRALTGLLLGVGKTVRDLAGSEGSGVHGRSVSLDEEGLGLLGGRRRGSMSPDVVLGRGVTVTRATSNSSGGGSANGRRSVDPRRSAEPSRVESLRDDVTRRLAARADSALGGPRPPSAFNTLDQRVLDTPSPLGVPASASRHLATGSGNTTRRLFMPREQREMQQNSSTPSGRPMPTIHSQETLYGEYEPSPTPASRINQGTLDRSRTLPSLNIPKPLPSLPSESLRRNQSLSNNQSRDTIRDKDHDRRKASVTSIQTIRAASTSTSPFPPSLTTPSNATTAITPTTVSTTHTPERTSFPSLPRLDSEGDRSTRTSGPTFSRPSTVSVSALNGLQQQDLEIQRRRTESSTSSGAEPSTSVPPARRGIERVQSGSETERPPPAMRQTLGRMGRASLDHSEQAGAPRNSTVHAADRSAALAARGGGGGGGSMLPPMNTERRRERRRTVTDIWPNEKK